MDPPSSVTGWRHVWVHIPDNGATTFRADYKIQDHPDADPVLGALFSAVVLW